MGILFNIGQQNDMTVHKKLMGSEAALQGVQSLEGERDGSWRVSALFFYASGVNISSEWGVRILEGKKSQLEGSSRKAISGKSRRGRVTSCDMS